MSLWELSLLQFRERAASASPTPGGGSVAAVCGALGASLISMALEISLRKATDVEAERLQAILQGLRPLLSTLAMHADGDVQAFDQYVRALALPKENNEEQSRRRLAIQEALMAATAEPMASARDMLSALDVALAAAETVHVHVLSDVAAGADLLHGAMTAALRNVDINLPRLKNIEERERFSRERREMALVAEEKHRRTGMAISTRLPTGS